MGEQCLSALAILSVERELSGTLSISQVLDESIHGNKNRKIICFKLIIIDHTLMNNNIPYPSKCPRYTTGCSILEQSA